MKDRVAKMKSKTMKPEPGTTMKRLLKLWSLPLLGISALLAWAYWGGASARYLLFTHHLFWMAAAMLLINPITETIWPSQKKQREQPERSPIRTSRRLEGKQKRRAPASTAEQEAASTRLARLLQEKQAVEKELERHETRAAKSTLH